MSSSSPSPPVPPAARSLFIGGTASHVGKTWFTTAFCRLLHRQGRRVAPFKAQNMSNNSYPCVEGGEIGRAQAMQAEACGLPPMADMNPVLLKPNSATGSQVIVNGRLWNALDTRAYFTHTTDLFDIACAAYHRLAAQFDTIVCEGAGSIAEVNLQDRDITNLRLAARIQAPALLVADIERGGVFASLTGTLDLLPHAHRALVRAFAVNRFRGDRSLFDDGVRFLEQRLGIPCLGVFPYERGIHLDEEDSVALDHLPSTLGPIAVIRLPHISNFTDFRPFPSVTWIDRPLDHPFDIIFLPGTKSTIPDLAWLRAQGLDQWIRSQHARGARIVGICGGYQMLGRSIADPQQFESTTSMAEGLGLLPVHTVLRAPKTTRTVTARTPTGIAFSAYEIHMGDTTLAAPTAPFAFLGDQPEGATAPRVLGTYLHGAFDHPQVTREWLGVESALPSANAAYDTLADWLQQYSRPAVLEALLA